MKEVSNLHEQLEHQRKSLRDVDDSLKRLSGRSKSNNLEENRAWKPPLKIEPPIRPSQVIRPGYPSDNYNKNGSNYSQDLRRQNDNDRSLKRKSNNNDDYANSKSKRVMNERSTSGRRGGQDDEIDMQRSNNQAIRSSVSSISKNIKSREELIQIQTKFNGSEQRNRRIIGLLVGTLREFKSDDNERSSTKQALDRKELEKKIEIKKVEEIKRIAEEKKKLEIERARNMRNIKIIEKKIELTDSFSAWKKNQTSLRHFIRTKTEPAIFYLPRTLNPQTQALLDASTRAIDEKIEAKKSEIEKELDALTQESEALMSVDQSENAEDMSNQSPEQQSDESKSNNVTTTVQKEETEEALGQEPADVELVEEEMTTEAADSSEVADQASNVAVVPSATNDALSTSPIAMPQQAQEPEQPEK